MANRLPLISTQRGFSRGYTLIEVLATTTILGIAAAVCIPRMGSRADLEVAAAARQVLGDLDVARSEAITRNIPVYLKFTGATGLTPGGSYSVYKAWPSTFLINPITKDNWTTTFGSASFKAVSLTSAAFDSQTTLVFDETGSPYSCSSGGVMTALASGQIQLNCRGVTMNVVIEPLTGALSVQ